MVTGKLGLIAGVLMLFASCKNSGSLEGKWKYAGGIYNGKAEGGTDGYQLQRNYTGKNFEAFLIEGGGEPQKYQAGDYALSGDSCLETETFSTQPSKLTGITVHYQYKVKNDTLVFKGKLPTGIQVEERWTKLK
jgi:hypothetical protein